jgi:hypothetical protein
MAHIPVLGVKSHAGFCCELAGVALVKFDWSFMSAELMPQTVPAASWVLPIPLKEEFTDLS